MTRSFERRGGALVMIVDPVASCPKSKPLNGYYLRASGYEIKGSEYIKDGVTVNYDGCYWTCNGVRIETIEELEKMIA